MRALALVPQAGCPEDSILTGPDYEYVQILRTFLTEQQQEKVYDEVQAQCLAGRVLDTMDYAGVIQSHLTSAQKASALERLELVFHQRGWLVPSRA